MSSLNTLKDTRGQVLQRHIRRLDGHLGRLEALNAKFFWFRLGALLGGAGVTAVAFFAGPDRLGQALGLLSIAAFSVVVYFHRRLDQALLRFKLARGQAATQLARLELDWEAIPLPPALDPQAGQRAAHPYAGDLNLSGPRSLHQLLDTALSLGGSRRLHDWLLAPRPDPAEIERRQALVQEIGPLTGLRSRLALSGALVSQKKPGERWEGSRLLAWLEEHPAEGSLRLPLLALAGLAAANWALLALYLARLLPAYWILTLILYAGLYITQYRRIGDLFGDAYDLSRQLELLRTVLVYLESYPYPRGSRLAQLAAPFWDAARRPSRYLRGLAGIASAASLQGNPILWLLLNAALPWDLFFAHRLNQAKDAIRGLLPAWLEAWYELEALNSLANFAYLNPGYVFPTLLPLPAAPAAPAEANAPPPFAARELGHPLIPHRARVCNSFSLNAIGEVTIITGSNMSGKSTFLRTLGINLVLAFAGGPVDAAELRTLPFRLFTCINVSDSLSDGISYFYAEVRRLKALLEELKADDPYPMFFLIDEIFRGTNNRERQIGSRAYVQALAGRWGAGLISTHDLELVHLEEEIPGLRNFHFREDVAGDRMVFDYRLRPGPSPTTNALKIMEIEGLPVRPV